MFTEVIAENMNFCGVLPRNGNLGGRGTIMGEIYFIF
jgi:hypothetical protein